MSKVLFIHYDFSTNNEKSYGEIKSILDINYLLDNDNIVLETHCLSFFNFDYLEYLDDIIVINKDSMFISVKDMLENKGSGYCNKEIRETHNIYKILISGHFKFKTLTSIHNNKLYKNK